MGILAITLQDLRFRARQFLIAVIGAGLVFAMGLLLTGLAAGFSTEINQTVQGMGADSWVLAAGAAGRIAGLSPLPITAVSAVAHESGVTRADPIIVAPQAVESGAATLSINMIGAQPGGLGSPTVTDTVTGGHALAGNGEAVVDTGLGLGIGRHFSVAGLTFTVVGTVADRTLLGGVANVYVTVHDAQAVLFGGRPLISAVLTSGIPAQAPPGLSLHTNGQIEAASLAQMASAVSSISNSRAFSWVVAVFIVAALVYVTALERTRDFAVLKALGSSSTLLFIGLAIQSVLVSLAAAAIAALVSNFMKGLFDQPVDIPTRAFVILPITAVVVGILSSLAALRRAVSADPAIAFAG
ncbi:MAG: ABC transporter permease [Acidimicrobiales bacterium]